MADRGTRVAFVIGVVGSCVLGLVPGHHEEAFGLTLTAAATVAVVALSLRALRHRRLVGRLRVGSRPAHLAGVAVRVGPMRDAAFVVGLTSPTIYCDRDLPDQLSPAQLRAVLLHERAHQRSSDPARLLALDVVAPLARWLPFGRTWIAWVLAQREIAADRDAMVNGASRADLAGALLKLPPLAQAHVAGFTSAVDLRLQALLGEDVSSDVPQVVRRSVSVIAGLLIGAAVCALLLHRVLAALTGLI